MQKLAGVGKVAEELDLSTQHIQRLVHLGLPKAKRGKYDILKCFRWYVRYKHELERSRRAETTDPVEKERLRLITAQANQAELNLMEQNRELVSVTEVKSIMATQTLTAKRQLLNLPARIAPRLEGENRTVIKALLHAEMCDALLALSVEFKGYGEQRSIPEPTAAAQPAAGVVDLPRGTPGAASEPEGERVGGT